MRWSDVSGRPGTPQRKAVWVVGVLLALGLVGAVVAPWVYINLIKEDAPPPLTFEQLDKSPATSVATGTNEVTVAPAGENLSGSWAVVAPSQAGYRVKEVLFGQDTEAVGRTGDVEGSITVEGTTVTAGELSVDLTTVTSDESRRDGQFQGRIMNTAEFSVALFTLTTPIGLGPIPTDGTAVAAKATGSLALRGVDRDVTIDLQVRRSGTNMEVSGSYTVVFADFEIPDPSNMAATTGDEGLLEFILMLQRRA